MKSQIKTKFPKPNMNWKILLKNLLKYNSLNKMKVRDKDLLWKNKKKKNKKEI